MNANRMIFLWIVVFSIAMAALEAAVVVYLRALYYPDQFTVAFRLIDENILLVELAREAATLVMLLSVGIIAGKNFNQRLAWFLVSFAIWDISYYAWLKVFIDWPSTLFDWDILFLIPITWIGPVAAPLICSVVMMVLGITLLRPNLAVPRTVWALILAGVVLTLFTFMRDYAGLIIDNDLVHQLPNLLKNELFLEKAAQLEPQPYLWSVFWIGQLMFLSGIALLLRETSGRSAGLSAA